METFTMSRKEVPRAGLVKAALAGKITNQEGARALRLTVRQFKRLKARVRREGLRGLVHRRRGQPSPRRVPVALRTQVVTLMTTTYAGFNDVHLTEKLQQLHALPVSRATVRRIRLALGRPPHRQRRAPKHRRRRPRAPRWGNSLSSTPAPSPGSRIAGRRPPCMGSSTTPPPSRSPSGFALPKIFTATPPCSDRLADNTGSRRRSTV